jgi:hypothetical protein
MSDERWRNCENVYEKSDKRPRGAINPKKEINHY